MPMALPTKSMLQDALTTLFRNGAILNSAESYSRISSDPMFRTVRPREVTFALQALEGVQRLRRDDQERYRWVPEQPERFTLSPSRQRTMIYRDGEPFARIAIPPGSDADAAAKKLCELLNREYYK